MNTLKTLVQKIEESNEAFNKMSKSEKRMQIARDCIDRIKVGQLRPDTGKLVSYVFEDYQEGDLFFSTNRVLKKDDDDSVRDYLNNPDEITTCQVCAKGGLFMSYVGRVNDFTFGDDPTSNDLNHYQNSMAKLLEIFTDKQLIDIEVAFENKQYVAKANGEPYEANAKSFDFYGKFDNTNDRLIGICENIIKNKGTFKP